MSNLDPSGSSSTSQPPTKKARYHIGQVLYRQVETRENVDVVFLIGQNGQTRLKAHKNVLMGVSDLFSSKLSERWGQEDKEIEGMGVIKLDENVTVEAATAFIKAMYFGEVDDHLTLDHLLEMIVLCEQFLAQELITVCKDGVIKLIGKNNCVQIFEKCQPLDGFQSVVDQSLLCLKKNLLNILSEPSHPSTQWCAETWRQVLLMEGEEMKDDWEKTIFLELMRWKETSDIEEPEFRQLVNFVRFPRMDAQTIASVVDPKNVLSDKEIADLLCYIVGGGAIGKRILAFNFDPRCKKIAVNSDELLDLLLDAQPGDFIQLVDTEYVGRFPFSVDKITIRGVGESTKLVLNDVNHEIVIGIANDIRVSNLSIEYQGVSADRPRGLAIRGSRNLISNVAFKMSSLAIDGNHSRIENVSFDGGEFGLYMAEDGFNNNISNVTLQNVTHGIYVARNNCSNNIQRVSCRNVENGVELHGDNNVVSYITHEFSSTNVRSIGHNEGLLQGLAIAINGSGNVVDDVAIIQGESKKLHDVRNNKYKYVYYAIAVLIKEDRIPSNNKITNCGPGACVVLQEEKNILKNINAARYISIDGSDHRLEDCTSIKFDNHGAVNVELRRCNFEL